MEPALSKIGKRIREIRKTKGYSQASLGEKCGFTFSYIGGIERAENNVSINNLEKIANALGVELFEFFVDHRDRKQLSNKSSELENLVGFLTTLNDKELRKASTVLKEIFK